jgi:rSAM/selenodomain-associated transferase 1
MTAVIMFAKAPRPGHVKTRLASAIGDQRAVQAYSSVGAQIVAEVGANYALSVWYDPPDGLDEMRAWLGDLEYSSQPEGDLGARMCHAFEQHFGRGDRPVIAVGADAPGVTAGTVRAAEQALIDADVVLGPALDGGYYLIGLNGPESRLFRDIPWGSDDVLQVTLDACKQWHLRVVMLEPLRDLDTADDLEALGLDRP